MRIFYQDAVAGSPELAAVQTQHHADLTNILRRAQEAGELGPCDASLLAAAVMGATKELLRQMATRPDDHPFDDLPDLVFSLLIDPLRKN